MGHKTVHEATLVYEGDNDHSDVWVAIGVVRLPEGGCEILLGRGETAEAAKADAQEKLDEAWAAFAKKTNLDPSLVGG